MELLYQSYEKDKERVKCEDVRKADESKKNPKKCSITFNETVRLDYEFVDREEHTMYPEKIVSYWKNRTTSEWSINSKLIYLNFTAIFSDEQIVSSDLPLRKGCKRLNTEDFPKIETNYGSRFEMELEVLFNYTTDHGRYWERKKLNYSLRTYSVKLYTDGSVNVADTIDETTNASIRTFYNADHSLHSVTSDGKCQTYNLTSVKSLNWFYLQEIFVRRPELFYTRNNYSYLRDVTLDDVPYQVFEKKFDYTNRLTYEALRDPGNSTDQTQATSRKRNNDVPLEHNKVFSTHYYANQTDQAENQLSVPKKIELTIFNRFGMGVYSELVINVKSFEPNPEEREKFDASKCVNMDKK